MGVSAERLCALARKHERANRVAHWTVLGLTPLLAIAVIYELVRLYAAQRHLLVATEGWLLATLFYVLWRLLRGGPRRIQKTEPCIQFLKREFEGKRESAKLIRLWILLLIPAVLAAWWAGGPALRARSLGIKSGLLLGPHEPVVLILVLLPLAFIWFAMGTIAEKAKREAERLDE